MSDFVHKPGRFTGFANKKEGNPNRPDFTGDGVDPEGKPFKVSIWRKQGGKGEFLSGNIEYKTDVKPVAKEKPFQSDSSMPDDALPF